VVAEVSSDSLVSIAPADEGLVTSACPEDLRLALKSVFSYLFREKRRKTDPRGRPRPPVAVGLHEERGRPCITIEDPSVDLSQIETAQLLEPHVVLASEAGRALELDTGLTIANQVLRRNGASLRVLSPEPGGICFQFSLQPGDESEANWEQ